MDAIIILYEVIGALFALNLAQFGFILHIERRLTRIETRLNRRRHREY